MMKKAIKKLLAALLAVAMVCAMVIPAFADTEGDITTWHSFSAFQIFTGDVTGNNIDDFKISNVGWGSNITEPDSFLAKLKEDPTIGNQFKDAATVQDVLAVISKWRDSDNNSIAFARFVCSYLYPDADANPTPAVPGGSSSLTFNEAGYYLIVDTTDFKPGDSYHAYNSFLLKVTKANYNIDITPKAEKPTVEKKVYDNDDESSSGDNNGWGSSADHAINEEFQFQLIATLPASPDRAYDYYDEYAVLFNDTLSKGITYDRLDSVVIESKGTPYDITNSSKYNVDISHLESSNYFAVVIPDVKACGEGLNLNDGATITVTYTAHLNENAYVNTGNGKTENKNEVQLQYSNNPKNSSYWGVTPKDEVCVYTYQLNNTKHQNTESGPVLQGAGFRLYSDEACTGEQEIKLKKNDDGTYSRDFSAGATGVEMTSDKDGKFNVKGLDAGTYYLKETTTPEGFTPCSVIPVTIKANHTKDHVELSGETKLNYNIINKAGGITLPSTGGMGTTLFYVVGGGLMVAAIVLLVTKKRMENK